LPPAADGAALQIFKIWRFEVDLLRAAPPAAEQERLRRLSVSALGNSQPWRDGAWFYFR